MLSEEMIFGKAEKYAFSQMEEMPKCVLDKKVISCLFLRVKKYRSLRIARLGIIKNEEFTIEE